jgi:hypothetical protein
MSKRTAAHKARTVVKHHKHVKPAAAHHKAATGHAQKHHKAAKHHAAAKKHKGTVARGLAAGAEVASCAAEALAASARLSGLPAGPVEVLELYWRTAGDADAGASISDTLQAASIFGLGGIRPVNWRPADPGAPGVVLGVDLPGPHTVLATPEGWWSWGELFCPWCEFPDAVIEEAWEVSWR